MQFEVEEYITLRPHEAVGDAFAHIQLNMQMRDEILQCIYWLVSIGTRVQRELRREGMRLSIHCRVSFSINPSPSV